MFPGLENGLLVHHHILGMGEALGSTLSTTLELASPIQPHPCSH